MSLFKSVFKSVFKRKDVNIFLTFAFLPVLVPLLSGFMEGMSSEYTGNFLSFLESAVSTQYRFVLPILLFSLVVSSVFKDEIDSGIMFLYKDINRKKIFNAKLLSLVVVYSIFWAWLFLWVLCLIMDLCCQKEKFQQTLFRINLQLQLKVYLP